jgi:crossover junction endodeoxyribonuclease RuvC
VKIAGLDVSTSRIGYAAPDGRLFSITARAGASDPARRLYELIRNLETILAHYPPRPDLFVIEGYSLASPGRLALIRLGEIGGVIRLRLFEREIPYVEIPPSSLKRFATGHGNATKEQMIRRAIELGAHLHGSDNDDEADAYHLRRMGRAANCLEGQLVDHELDAISNAGVAW